MLSYCTNLHFLSYVSFLLLPCSIDHTQTQFTDYHRPEKTSATKRRWVNTWEILHHLVLSQAPDICRSWDRHCFIGHRAGSLSMPWKASEMLMETIKHYSTFPATGVSLRQMVQFGETPSTGAFLLPSMISGRDGRLTNSWFRNAFPCISVFIRRASHTPRPSSTRTWGFARWIEWSSLNQKSSGLVRAVIWGIFCPQLPGALHGLSLELIRM